MFTTYPIMNATAKTINVAAFEMRHGQFNTASFFSSLSVARFQLSSERKYLKSAEILQIILDRCESLYFTVYRAFCDLQKSPAFEKAVYSSALEIALSSLMLFDFVTVESGKRDLEKKADIVLARADNCLYFSRICRFRSLSTHKSIGKALPEIEYICNCDRVILKSKRLIHAYFPLL